MGDVCTVTEGHGGATVILVQFVEAWAMSETDTAKSGETISNHIPVNLLWSSASRIFVQQLILPQTALLQ